MRTASIYLSLALSLALGLLLYLQWLTQRPPLVLLSDLRPAITESRGVPGPHGNLLMLEVPLTAADYQSPHRLERKLGVYLDQAAAAGWLGPRTVVVLPEHVGTGLFAVGEKPEVLQARTLRDAMHWMALSNPWDYLRALLANQARDRRTEAVLRIKAPETARHYQQVFGTLASRYRITLVAGSVVLPEPRLDDGKLHVGDGALRQVSMVFGPDGQVHGPLWPKASLSRYEQRFISADLPPQETVATPAGHLAVRLGCDVRLLETLTKDAQLLAVPGLPHAGQPCPDGASALPEALPTAGVRTLGLPWNLLGSPRRPDPLANRQQARLTNQWLAAP